MINYTERLTLLMQDIVSRVPALSFIDHGDVLVFARSGRSNAEGAFATCHCLTLPPSEPGYYFWRDRATHAHHAALGVVRHEVAGGHASARAPIKYMISFALPRFCDQSLDRSRKERFYPGAEPWIAKLDTVIHELYHIDPELARHPPHRARATAPTRRNCHGQQFFEQVAEHGAHLSRRASRRRTSTISCATISPRSTRATAASSAPASARSRRSRSATSNGSADQLPCEADSEGVSVEPLRAAQQPTRYTRGRPPRAPVHEGDVAAADSEGRQFRAALVRQFTAGRRGSAATSRLELEMLDAHHSG